MSNVKFFKELLSELESFVLKRESDATISLYYRGMRMGVIPSAFYHLPDNIRLHESMSAFKNFIALNSPDALAWKSDGTFTFCLNEIKMFALFGRVKSIELGDDRLIVKLDSSLCTLADSTELTQCPPIECSLLPEDLEKWQSDTGEKATGEFPLAEKLEYYKSAFQAYVGKYVGVEAYRNMGYSRPSTNIKRLVSMIETSQQVVWVSQS